MKLKLLKQLKLNVIGKTYTMNKERKSIFNLENRLVVTFQIYYVIGHNNGGYSLIKDERIIITDYDNPYYNPWQPVYQKAEKERLEIHHLEYWGNLKSEKKQSQQKILK